MSSSMMSISLSVDISHSNCSKFHETVATKVQLKNYLLPIVFALVLEQNKEWQEGGTIFAGYLQRHKKLFLLLVEGLQSYSKQEERDRFLSS